MTHNNDPFNMEAFIPPSAETLKLLDDSIEAFKPLTTHRHEVSLVREIENEEQSGTLIVGAEVNNLGATVYFNLPDEGVHITSDASAKDEFDYLLQASAATTRAQQLAEDLPDDERAWLLQAVKSLDGKSGDRHAEVQALLSGAPEGYEINERDMWYLHRKVEGTSFTYEVASGNETFRKMLEEGNESLITISLVPAKDSGGRIFDYSEQPDGRRQLDIRDWADAHESTTEARQQGAHDLTEAKAKEFIAALAEMLPKISAAAAPEVPS